MVITVGLPTVSLTAVWDAPINFGILGGAATSFFIYTGFEGLANLVGESKDPTKNLPRALVISLSITLILYVLVALSMLGLVSPEQLAASASPLATALEKVSVRLADGIGWIALISTTNTALISLLVANRLLFGIASNEALPKFLTRISSRHVPWVTTLLVFGISVLLLPLGKVKELASLSSFLVLLVFIMINFSVIVLRYREPNLRRPFQIPGAIKQFPILPALGVVSNLVLLTRFEKVIYLWGAIIIVFFSALLRLMKRRSVTV
jgi:amino acid transporter